MFEDDALFQTLCEAMAAGVAVIDAKGCIAYWNPAAERIAGRPRAAVLGLTCDALLPPDHELATGDGTCAPVGQPSLYPPEGSDVACALVRSDGTAADVLRSVRHFTTPGATGRTIRYAVITFIDVSEARRRDAELAVLRETLRQRETFFGMVGASRPMNELYDFIERVAATPSTVLVTGESGTGKELVAAAIHHASPRAAEPFVSLNCAAVPVDLVESELFGHVRGSFTGAVRDRIGRFEAAHTGTLFLDEVGEMPLSTQVKLLRVLQTRQFERVGEVRSRSVDVRVVCATNRDLKAEVAAGRFREDLYFRLAVIELAVPPLRAHKLDIPQLAAHFLRVHADRARRRLTGFEPEVMRVFMRHDWPGNIRELENLVEYLVAMARGETVSAADLPVSLTSAPHAPAGIPELPFDLTSYVAEIERQSVRKALETAHDVKAEAARALGLTDRVFRYKLKLLDKSVKTTKLSDRQHKSRI